MYKIIGKLILSVKMKGELSKLFLQYFPSLDFKIILVNSLTIGSLFKFKDFLPLPWVRLTVR